MNNKGFTLTELMVVAAIAGIISLFSFESVKQIIRASIGVQKKANFNGLVEELRGVANKLDQCTCNFQGLSIASTAVGAVTNVPVISRFTNAAPTVVGGPPCQGALEIVRNNIVKYETEITSLELVEMQYLARMSLLRASLYVEGRMQTKDRKIVRRKIPLMFSTSPSGGGVTIGGCIGMTR